MNPAMEVLLYVTVPLCIFWFGVGVAAGIWLYKHFGMMA